METIFAGFFTGQLKITRSSFAQSVTGCGFAAELLSVKTEERAIMLVTETEIPNTTRVNMNIVARTVAKDTLTRLPLSVVTTNDRFSWKRSDSGGAGCRLMANA